MATKKFYKFTDRYVFPLVMQDKEICRGILELILPDEEIGEIRYIAPLENEEVTDKDKGGASIETEKTLKFDPTAHGVRLDVYLKLKNIWVEIEMQVQEEKHIGKRSRYYQSNIDLDALQEGTLYGDLPKSYIIFICKHDNFKCGKPLYRFETYDVENQLNFGDEAYKIILNAACDPANVPEELLPLYDYIQERKVSNDELIQKIDRRVHEYNSDEWRTKFMTLEQEIYNERMESYKEGIEQGMTQGLQQGEANKARSIAAGMKAKGMDVATIAELTGLSEEEIGKL